MDISDSKDYSFNVKRLNSQFETLLTLDDVDIVIDYYWNSHGKLVDWHGYNGNSRDELHADTVKIVKETYDLQLENVLKLIPSEKWHLYINGEKVDVGDIESYNKRKKLFIKSIMGAG